MSVAAIRQRVHAWLAVLSRLVTRRSIILATAMGWVAAIAILVAMVTPEPVVVLVLLVMGLITITMMQLQRQLRVVLAELRNRSWQAGPVTAGAELARGGHAEVVDRLKLAGLSLGRISEDLAAARADLRRAVVRESVRVTDRLEALHNLYAIVEVAGQLPPLPLADWSPRLVLRLVELLRTQRPGLVVGCGAGAWTGWAALAARQFDLDVRIVVLEHDPAAVAGTEAALAAHGVADRVTIRLAQLKPVEGAAGTRLCYQPQSWRDLDQLDVLFVDERFAGVDSGGLAALPQLAGRLKARGVVLLADPGRWDAGEEVERWLATGSWTLEEGAVGGDGVVVLRHQPQPKGLPGSGAPPTARSAPSAAAPVDHQIATELARAARSVGRHDDAWVLSYYPVARTNPFQSLLYSRALAAGFAPVGLPQLDHLAGLGSGPLAGARSALHVHWTAHVIGDADHADQARARVAQFVSQLRRLQEQQVRIIWTVHNRLPHRCGHPEVEIGLRQELADLVDVVHVLGPEAAAGVGDLYRLPADRLLLAPHPSYLGAYPTHFDRELVRLELGFEPDDFVVGLIGSIQPYKGVDELIDAVTGSEPLPPRLRTVVAGIPGQDPESQRLVDRLTRTEAIRSVPRKLDNENLARLVTALDVMVLPYRAPLTSGAALLSLSFGTPIVAPGLGPFRPLAEQGYCLAYDRDEPGGLVQALRQAPDWVGSVDREAMRKDMASLAGPIVSERFFADLRELLERGSA
jgi:glycosyltransferase involved in cell wall biosynthesis